MEKTNLAATDPPEGTVADKTHDKHSCANKEVCTATDVSGSGSQKEKPAREGANCGVGRKEKYTLSQDSTSSEDLPVACLATKKGATRAITRLAVKKALSMAATGETKKAAAKTIKSTKAAKAAVQKATKTTTRSTTKASEKKATKPTNTRTPATAARGKPPTRISMAASRVTAAKAATSRGTAAAAASRIANLEDHLGASDQLLLNARQEIDELQQVVQESKEKIKQYENEI